MQTIKSFVSKFGLWILLGFLFSLALFFALSLDLYPRGSDAYFYLLQAKYYFFTGSLKVPESSFLYRFLGLLPHSGLSFENSLTFYISLSLCACFLTSISLLYKTLIERNFFFLLLFFWLLISPGLLFIALEFPKMFSACLFLPLIFYFIQKNQIRFALLFLVLLPLLHRSFIFISATILVFLSLTLLRHHKIKKILGILLSLICLFTLYSYFFTDFFHWKDLQRLNSHFGKPALLKLFARESLARAIKIELLFSIFFSFYLTFKIFLKKTSPSSLLPLLLIFPALLPLESTQVLDWGERLALLLPFLTFMGWALYFLKNSSLYILPRKTFYILFCIGVLVSLLGTKTRLNLAYPQSLKEDYSAYSKLLSVLKEKEIPLLISHKKFAYFYTYHLMRDAFAFEPENHWDKTQLWRLVYKIEPEELLYYLPSTCQLDSQLLIPLEMKDYYLLREDCWHSFRKAISEAENEDLYYRIWKTTLNPSQKRPSFLYRKYRQKQLKEAFPAISL